MTIIHILLFALVPTILIELMVLLLLRERSARVLASSVLVNIFTNVPLNLYTNYISYSLLTILCGEVIVFLVEALWYFLFLRNLRLSLIYSFLCNAISFLTGLLAELIYLYVQNT